MEYDINFGELNLMAEPKRALDKECNPDEQEVLDWDVALDVAPPRPSGTVEVLLNQVKPSPLSVERDS